MGTAAEELLAQILLVVPSGPTNKARIGGAAPTQERCVGPKQDGKSVHKR